jgi:hypothetical protein
LVVKKKDLWSVAREYSVKCVSTKGVLLQIKRLEFKNILWNEKETREYLLKKNGMKKNELRLREENMIQIKENNKGVVQALNKIHEDKEKVGEKQREEAFEKQKEKEMKSNFITRLKCEPLALNFYKSLLREFKQKF